MSDKHTPFTMEKAAYTPLKWNVYWQGRFLFHTQDKSLAGHVITACNEYEGLKKKAEAISVTGRHVDRLDKAIEILKSENEQLKADRSELIEAVKMIRYRIVVSDDAPVAVILDALLKKLGEV